MSDLIGSKAERSMNQGVLYSSGNFALSASKLVQEGLVAELTSPHCLHISTEGGATRSVRIPTTLPQGCPGYRSNIPLLTAMYNLAAHELHENITPQGLLSAGAAWGRVWTRDIAYAAALGANLAAPAATRRSLAACISPDGTIRQDTGTGGSWPISTDRVAWALGAWAYYESTGDAEWLNLSIQALIRTLRQDAAVLSPAAAPLIPGETSFIDWRNQSYPTWMSPAQIGASYAFGTNVLHYTARRILCRMLAAAGRPQEAEPYAEQAHQLAAAINHHFYNPATHSYSMFTDANGCRDPHTDALATALAVLCGLAEQHAAATLQALPRSPYGTPVFTPYKTDTPEAYHNRAIWPFVEAYVLLAHAELQDLPGVERSMAAMLRAAMAFGTNKENLHATTGSARHTIQNSDRQLWSAAGMLALFYHGLLGIQYEHDNLVFSPCIPKSFAGSHWFTGLRIRGMTLDIHLNGYGNEIASVIINGKTGLPIIPLDTTGHIQIELELLPADTAPAPTTYPTAGEDLMPPPWDSTAPPTPLRWQPVPGATAYRIYADGRPIATTADTTYTPQLPPGAYSCRYQVQALGEHAASSLAEPRELAAPGAQHTLHPLRIGEHAQYPVEHAQAWLDSRPCTAHLLYQPATLPAGDYLLRIHYANATASLRDGDSCALRELRVDGQPVGIIPLPHNTEQNDWETYSDTAPLRLHIPTTAEHTFSLHHIPTPGSANQCMVRHLTLTRL